ncbi:MAG: hypothetical protein ACYCXQ_11870 [Candidatus Humimicrobiaceae bacterium]
MVLLYVLQKQGLIWANGGAKEPCTDLLNLEDIKPDLTDEDDNPFNVDLTFIKKIKVV